jgi:hypothetical protein
MNVKSAVSLDALPKRKKGLENRGPTNGVLSNRSIKNSTVGEKEQQQS